MNNKQSYDPSKKALGAAKLPKIPVKIEETTEEVKQVLMDLRAHSVDMLTLGQYLQPTRYHMPVDRYAPPAEFNELGDFAREICFTHVASGPLVRSSYHADRQAAGKSVC